MADFDTKKLRKECILSLDVGSKTIGIARGNQERGIGTPMMVLRRKSVKKDSTRLAEICQQHNVAIVVVGLPYNLDGSEGRSAKLARQVGEALGALTRLPIFYQDEQFSTLEASRRLSEAGVSAKKQKSRIDQAAAAVILEDWFRANAT